MGSIIATSVPGVERIPPGIIGRPLFDTEIVLVDPESLAVVAASSLAPATSWDGLLCIASPWPGLTNAAFGSPALFCKTYLFSGTSFFSTGDTATIDPDAHFKITGRSDDQLSVNSRRVGPAEVEAAIMEVDGVADVAVVGVSGF
jgi:acetyl-CoA synthetase